MEKIRILTEAAGCLASSSGIRNIQKAGFVSVGTDANPDCFAKILCDEFYCVPFAGDPHSMDYLEQLCVDKKIDLVIPSLDEGMIKWARKKKELEEKGVAVAISPEKTIEMCEDKWLTYLFFEQNGIPTPKSSLQNEYALVKPRLGRGGSGITVNDKSVNMDGMISQELLSGTEYTTDVLCDLNGKPIYIVPRKRLGVKDGKSTGGIVEENKEIIKWVEKICDSILFQGPINIQCFVDDNGNVKFTEINPRLGGGTPLGMAATENWFPIIVDLFVNKNNSHKKVPVQYGLKMGRFYDEVFYL